MMNDERTIKIKRDNANGVDVAELPFKGGRFSLYIALPQKVDGITDLGKLRRLKGGGGLMCTLSQPHDIVVSST